MASADYRRLLDQATQNTAATLLASRSGKNNGNTKGPNPKAIAAFKARKEREQREAALNALREKERLLSLRAQSSKSMRKSKAMQSRTKDNDFSKITVTENEMKDQEKMEEKIRKQGLSNTKERMKARIEMDQKLIGLSRKDREKEIARMAKQEPVCVSVPSKVSSKPKLADLVRQRELEKQKNGTNAPKIMSYQELLDLAAAKSKVQISLEEHIKEEIEAKQRERPMTAKEKEAAREEEYYRSRSDRAKLPSGEERSRSQVNSVQSAPSKLARTKLPPVQKSKYSPGPEPYEPENPYTKAVGDEEEPYEPTTSASSYRAATSKLKAAAAAGGNVSSYGSKNVSSAVEEYRPSNVNRNIRNIETSNSRSNNTSVSSSNTARQPSSKSSQQSSVTKPQSKDSSHSTSSTTTSSKSSKSASVVEGPIVNARLQAQREELMRQNGLLNRKLPPIANHKSVGSIQDKYQTKDMQQKSKQNSNNGYGMVSDRSRMPASSAGLADKRSSQAPPPPPQPSRSTQQQQQQSRSHGLPARGGEMMGRSLPPGRSSRPPLPPSRRRLSPSPPPRPRHNLPPIGATYRRGMFNDYEPEYVNEDDDYYDDDEEDEMADFIDDGPEDGYEEPEYSSAIREIFGYDKRKYRMVDDDDDIEEASFAQCMKEEKASLRAGIQEDLEDIRREEEEKRRAKERKRMKRY